MTAEFVKVREETYGRYFGDEFTVSHELLPLVPHIDVYTFEPTDERPFYTLITGGMSDQPQHAPEGLPVRRVELVLYVEEPKQQYIDVLRWLAHLVHDQQTWFSPGSTMTNGNPPRPIFEGSELTCYFFSMSPFEPDMNFADELQIDGEPLFVLWVVPLSTAECEYLRENEDEFYALLDQNEHSVLLDDSRQSYV
jgi:hypothetical protein